MGDDDMDSGPTTPFQLTPVPVPRPWGGRKLARFGVELPEQLSIGESWEVADFADGVAAGVKDPCSRVASGPYAGASLGDLLSDHPRGLLGENKPSSDGRFPLLVKLLDARENLSVQVHPPAEYVRQHADARLKTESWYVIEAEPGAELLIDVMDGVKMSDIANRFGTPSFVDLLERVPAIAGEFHHIPAGLIHCLGGGVVVAEVQTPSDTTFRIYDWSAELDRPPRPIHRVESLASIRLHPGEAYRLAAMDGSGRRVLVSNDHYWMVEHQGTGNAVRLADGAGPRIVMAVSGRVSVGDVDLTPGRSVVIPASARDTTPSAGIDGVALEIGLGSPG